MKGSRSQNNMQNKSMVGHRPKPETRDDLDSRKNTEQSNKGGDVTHNEKYDMNYKPNKNKKK
jgi:hypothetical protein